MRNLQQTHQINFFTNNDDTPASHAIVSLLMERLSKFRFMPSFGQEINGVTGEKRQIITMIDDEQNIKIDFPSHGILLNSMNLNFEVFFEKALKILDVLHSCFPSKKANRLAVLSTMIYKSDIETYERLYNELFTYRAVKPFEWDNRIALRKKIENYDEQVNSISTIKRGEIVAPFVNGGLPSDCVIFETDTNTLPQNAVMRFGWDEAVRIIKALSKDNEVNIKRLARYTEI